MDQVSRPLLIALGAVIVLAIAWLTVLRPGTGAVEPVSEPPAVVGVASDAEQAVSRTDAASVRRGAAPGTEGAPVTGGTGAVPDPAVARGPAVTDAPVDPAAAGRQGEGSRRVLAQLDRGRAVVLLFWNGRSSDDRAVRRAVAGVDRRDGEVRVYAERLGALADYAAVTNGVRLEQTPTTLVIAPDRAVQAIAGYTVTSEIDQAVIDALREAQP